MRLVGIGRKLLVGAAVWGSVVACGSTGRNGAEDNASGSSAGGSSASGSGGTVKGGTNSGGNPTVGGAGKAAAGSAGAPPQVLTEADANEPCEADPLAANWTETVVELKAVGNEVIRLGAGGPLAIVIGFGQDGLLARTSTAGGPWTEVVTLPGTMEKTDYPERIEVSLDGSTAVVLWRRGEQMFFNLLGADGTFAPAVELKVPKNVATQVLALSGQRVLFGFGGDQGVQLIEYTPAGGLVSAKPILRNFSTLSHDGDEGVAVFATSGLIAEPDNLYPYTFGSGFAEPQAITARAMVPSAWQTFFDAFPNGRAARLTRIWEDAATRGMHLTTRTAGTWGTEELVNRFEGSITTWPLLSYAQDRLVLAWEDEDKHVMAVREHDGKTWQPELVLPRSRSLQYPKLVGAKTSAVLLGEQELKDEQVSVKKLYRRGADGTWYCPKLVPNDFSNELVSDGEGFWFAERLGIELHVWRFEP